MEFELIINKNKYRIQIDKNNDNVRNIKVNDKDFHVIFDPEDGSGSAQKAVIDGKEHKLEMIEHKLELGKAKFEIRVNDRFAALEAILPQTPSQEFLQDSSDNIAAKAVPKAKRTTGSKDLSLGVVKKQSAGGIYAPMPGRLVSLRVKVGDKVSPGQVVAILEAMKMENELKATQGGTVKSINYKPGENVAQNNPIMIIE